MLRKNTRNRSRYSRSQNAT